jgi:hypothetical protein
MEVSMLLQNENRTKTWILAVCSTVVSMTFFGQIFGFFQPIRNQALPRTSVAMSEIQRS